MNNKRPNPPFVIIEPYQYEGDVAFGFWDGSLGRYRLGDGDCYSPSELAKYWPEAKLLSWTELEARLKFNAP